METSAFEVRSAPSPHPTSGIWRDVYRWGRVRIPASQRGHPPRARPDLVLPTRRSVPYRAKDWEGETTVKLLRDHVRPLSPSAALNLQRHGRNATTRISVVHV